MLYEFHSCMYGGIYILQNSCVTDTFSFNVSEALFLCVPSNSMNNEEIVLGTHFTINYHSLGNYPSRCSAAKGAELDSAGAKQKAPFAAVWREAGAYII